MREWTKRLFSRVVALGRADGPFVLAVFGLLFGVVLEVVGLALGLLGLLIRKFSEHPTLGANYWLHVLAIGLTAA